MSLVITATNVLEGFISKYGGSNDSTNAESHELPTPKEVKKTKSVLQRTIVLDDESLTPRVSNQKCNEIPMNRGREGADLKQWARRTIYQHA